MASCAMRIAPSWGSRPATGGRPAAGSRRWPSVGPSGARDAARSSAPWAGHGRPTCRRDRAREPVLHVVSQYVVGGQLGHLRPPCLSIGVPLRGRGPVLQAAATGRGVATQLPGDRRGVSAQLTSDLAYPCTLGPKERDLFAFRERQVAARQRSQTGRRHAATLPEPPHPTAGDTPACRAASSLDSPRAIAAQNRCRSSRRATDGRPGDRIAGRPAKPGRRCPRSRIATPHCPGAATTRRPVESAQYTSWAFSQRAKAFGLVPSMGSVGACFGNGMTRVVLVPHAGRVAGPAPLADPPGAGQRDLWVPGGLPQPPAPPQRPGMLSPIEFETRRLTTVA
jgi:hypothetical protein